MFSIWFVGYVFFFATIIALLEIQIEGENGWAKNLPCWRTNPEWIITKIYSWFQSGKPVTGYHLALNTLEVSIFHFPFFAGTNWSLIKELQILSCICLFWVYQDFLWFLWNPHYGLKRFKPQNIWWHKKWKGPIPTDYLYGVSFSLIFALLGVALKGQQSILWWVETISILSALTCFSYVIQPIRMLGKATKAEKV